MTMNSSGPISLGGTSAGESINIEIGQLYNATVSLNDTNVRLLAGVTTPNSTITMPTNFYGKNYPDYWYTNIYKPTSINRVYDVSAGVDQYGNVFIGGYAETSPNTLYMAKLDSSGSEAWQYTITGVPVGYVDVSAQASGQSYIIAPLSGSFFICRLTGTGGISWQQTYNYGYANGNEANAITVNGSNVFVATNPYIASPGVYRAFLLSYTTSGTLNWQRQFNPAAANANATIRGMTTDSAGTYLFTAGRYYNASDNAEYGLLTQYNASTGALVAYRQYGSTTQYSVFEAVAPMSDSPTTLAVVGRTTGGSQYGCWVIKTDTSTNTIAWQRVLYSAGQVCIFFGVAVDTYNNVYAVGYIGATTGVLAKYDSNGTLLWQRSLSVSGSDVRPYTITLTTSGNALVVAGEIATSSTSSTRAFAIELPLDGSKTGTYNSLVYAASSYTSVTGSVPNTSISFTDSTPSYTSTAGTATKSAASYTITTTDIP